MEEIELKEFLEKCFENSPISALSVAQKLIELEAIEKYLNLMFGIELSIKVRRAERKEGRFYGKGLINNLGKLK